MDMSLLSKVLDTTTQGIKYIHLPLRIAKTTCRVGAWIPLTSDLSSQVTKRVKWISGSFDAVALVAGVVALGRVQSSQPVKGIKGGLATLKKGCDIILWTNWSGMVVLNEAAKYEIKNFKSYLGMAKYSVQLWNDIVVAPYKGNLVATVPKFLKASLLLIVQVSDNKRVKIYVKLAVKGLDAFYSGYKLYQKYQKIDYEALQRGLLTVEIYKVISSIAFTALTLYVVEINIDFNSLD